MVMKHFDGLKETVAEISDLHAAMALLEWDQQTYMPSNSAADRSGQIGTLAKLAHEKASSAEFGRLIDAASRETASMPADSMEVCLCRKLRRNFEKTSRVPSSLVARTAGTAAKAHHAWAEAKEKSDFSIFQPYLASLIDLRREYAELFRPYQNIYDPLLDNFEEGYTVAKVDPVFAALREKQVALLKKIASCKQVDDSFLHAEYDERKQLEFVNRVIARMGYDFTRGRQDMSAHPFTTSFGLNDVRITTKVFRKLPVSCLLSSVHECGHALYELGIDKALNRTPLGEGASFGFHESQSRLWENLVARSHDFWVFFYPEFRKAFPEHLANVSLEEFYRAVNKVEPSFIRTEADEATYNLHIMLRYEMEKDMLNGVIEVGDIPEAWNRKSQDYLGITPENDAQGVLQDIHWSMGEFGYFPTYALGNLIAAQIWARAEQELPSLGESIRKGDLSSLLGFLRRDLHVYGAKFTPEETLRLSTGSDRIDPDCFIGLLEKKYSAIYGF